MEELTNEQMLERIEADGALLDLQRASQAARLEGHHYDQAERLIAFVFGAPVSIEQVGVRRYRLPIGIVVELRAEPVSACDVYVPEPTYQIHQVSWPNGDPWPVRGAPITRPGDLEVE